MLLYLLLIRSSTSAAAAAFAIATSASSNPRERPSICSSTCSAPRGRPSVGDTSVRSVSQRDRGKKESTVISTAATMRVLNVLRHWVSKHAQVKKNLIFLLARLWIQLVVSFLFLRTHQKYPNLTSLLPYVSCGAIYLSFTVFRTSSRTSAWRI